MHRWAYLFVAAIVGSASVVACESESSSSDDGSSDYVPDDPPAGNPLNGELGGLRRCPGDPGCEPGGDPAFYAGAAIEDITPAIDHVVLHGPDNEEHEFSPLGGDRCVDPSTCDTTDTSTCAAVDPGLCTWIGGFGQGRSAVDVADPVSVRCVALKRGETSVALCSVDNILWLYNEVQRTRELLRRDHPEVDLDLAIVASNHLHQNRDTVGFYGPDTGTTGLDTAYNALVRAKTAAAIARAYAAMQPVTVQLGAIRVDGHLEGTDPGGHRSAAFVSDTRDPVVIDDELRTMRFTAADGTTVATLVNWCAHPEYAGSRNRRITADYLGTLRSSIEDGLDVRNAAGDSLYRADGVGGVAIAFPGLIGGQVGPGLVKYVGFDGEDLTGEPIERARNAGRLFAAYALESLGEGSVTLESPPLGFRAREIYVRAENERLLIGFNLGLFDAELEGFDEALPLGNGNFPVIRSEVVVLDLGPAELLTVPGEPHAEEFLATDAGASALEPPYAFTPPPYVVLNDPETNPSCDADGYSRCDDGPPDIDAFDRSLVVDLHRDPAARFAWVLSTTHGYNGYLVPEYDFRLDDQNPYLEEASPGNHYEETVTLTPSVAREVLDPIRQILRTRPVVHR